MARGERVPEIVRQEIRDALSVVPRPIGLITELTHKHQLSRMTINRIDRESRNQNPPPGSGSASRSEAGGPCVDVGK